jgi:hypothetical protein
MPERQSRDIVANKPARRKTIMTVERGALLRFMTLYAALFSAFGFASPFLPVFLQNAGSGPKSSVSCWVRQPLCSSYVVPSLAV